jgi:hypothetical protein
MRAAGVSIAGALAALAVGYSSAFAQAGAGLEPGVHVDPGSPAAKEYALPLNQARQTGTSSSSHASSPEATLFGTGIHPPRSGGSNGARSGSKTAGAPAGNAAAGLPRTGASGSSTALPSAVLRAVRSPASGGGDGSILALIGGGVAILVLGGFGGTVLKHNRRPSASG